MKIALKDFQEEAVQQLARRTHKASRDVVDGEGGQALVFSAPTGSGKTVVATALMERLIRGDDSIPANPDATFLWLTDQPELNEQTRKKVIDASDLFDNESLITIEAATFDQRRFDAGKVFFLNTQKLGRRSTLVKAGDERQYSLWETIANTAIESPADFILIIDEAHRGMQGNGVQEAQTLVQRLIVGSAEVGVPPVPMVFGVSATPDRFNRLLQGTDRTTRSYSVDPEDVRESGLLKDVIRLYHTDEDQPSDMSLLAGAAERLKDYETRWSTYSKEQQSAEVRPLLVVQVADGTKKQVTTTPIEEALGIIEKHLGALGPDEVAHCFDKETPIEVGTRTLPHISASDIEDSQLRVVLFKMALTTGWDSPRAEVMMSFRTAKDDTLIAQLVGRMVRTPLARRVGTSEVLNSVALYLPHYDQAELTQVIAKLSEADPDNGIPDIQVVRGNNLVTLKQNAGMKALFEAAAKLPVERVERVSKQSAVRRLLRLGRHLATDDLDKTALGTFQDALVAKLTEELGTAKGNDNFKHRFEEAGRIDVRRVDIGVGQKDIKDVQLSHLPVVARNVEDAFAEAGRKLSGNLHNLYLQVRGQQEGPEALPIIKRELFALLQDPGVLTAVEATAEALCNETLVAHQTAINQLSDERLSEYRRLRRQAAAPLAEPWSLPAEIEGPAKGKSWKRHLYLKENGDDFTADLNEWETAVMKEELADPSVLGWLRNDPRKPWAFSVSYQLDSEDRPMYPDFVVFRQIGKAVVCDVLEPHSLSWADSAAKAKGLAEFAHKNGEKFGRIQLIAKTGGKKFKRLDINDPQVGNKLRAVQGNEHLKQLVEGM